MGFSVCVCLAEELGDEPLALGDLSDGGDTAGEGRERGHGREVVVALLCDGEHSFRRGSRARRVVPGIE